MEVGRRERLGMMGASDPSQCHETRFDVAGWFGFLLPASGDGIDDFPNLAWVSGMFLVLTCEVLIPTTAINVRCLSSNLPVLLVELNISFVSQPKAMIPFLLLVQLINVAV